MQCQAGHWVHRDQEDRLALDKRKGNGNTRWRCAGAGSSRLGWGWGARRLGLAGRFPGVFWGCLSRRALGEEGGTLALLWEPQGTSRLWRRIGTAVLTFAPPEALLGNPVSEDTSLSPTPQEPDFQQ